MKAIYGTWDVVYAVRDAGFHFSDSMLRDYIRRGNLPPAIGKGPGPHYAREHVELAIALRREIENKPTLADLRDRFAPDPDDDEDDAA